MEKVFKIKKCQDNNLLKTLHSEIFPTDDWYTDPTTVSWVVWLDGKPVGFCMVAEWDGKYGFLARAGLLKEAQGLGLHLRLIKVRENYCRKRGFAKVLTYTKIFNITSSRNLQKSGYMLYIPKNPYADDDCLYWIKKLNRGKSVK